LAGRQGNERLADSEKGASDMAMNDGLVHVVDEELSVRETLRRMLEADGFAVRCHASAGDFLAAWPSAPGCVLLDVRMPGPAAFDLQLALAYRNDALPVVFMGAYGDLPMSVLALKRGTVHFVAEPIQREALLAAVGKAVERSHAQRELDSRRRAMRERLHDAHRARAGGVRAGHRGAPEQADRRDAVHLRAHGQGTSRQHDAEAAGAFGGRVGAHRHPHRSGRRRRRLIARRFRFAGVT
jgi:FixJ family two-component response regulator